MQALVDTISAKNQDGTLLREATSQYLYASKRVDRLSSFEHKPASDVRVLNEIFFVQGLDSEDLLCEHFQSFDDEEDGEGVNMFEAFDAETYQKIAEVVFAPTECKEKYWPNTFFDCAFEAIVTVVLDFVCTSSVGEVQTYTQATEKDVQDLVNNYFCYLGLREGTCDKEIAEEFEDAFGGMYEMLMAAIQ
jgi:hypothetical protein